MIVKTHLRLGNTGNVYVSGEYTLPDECPHCFKGIQPVQLSDDEFQNNDGDYFLSVTLLCKSCYKPFVALYGLSMNQTKYEAELIFHGPKGYKERVFDEAINKISPSFVVAYNQALEAESMRLTEISGLGYRRAVEFLVKDFLSSENPDKKEKILGMDLSGAINEYVKDDKIRSNVLQAYWLGHDYTHYVKVYEDAELSDLKDYIEGAVYWIGMELIAKKREKKPQPSRATKSRASNPTQTGS